MKKLDRMLSAVRQEAQLNEETRKHADMIQKVGRMTTDQLREIVSGEPSAERLEEILSSVE